MVELPKLELIHDKAEEVWKLRHQRNHHVVEIFDNKKGALKGGILAEALGEQGGSVRIKKLDGTIQEERTYPRRRDPPKSPG